MISCVLFDLDGTLVDTQKANLLSYKTALEHFEIDFFDDVLSKYVGHVSWSKLLQLCAPELPRKKAHDVAIYKREIYPEFFDHIRVNKGLVDLIKALDKKIKKGLVTSASRKSALDILAATNLLEAFDVTITSDDCGQHKPHPEPYQRAADILNVLPQQCLVFEDTDTGVKAARIFGAQTLKIEW